MISSTALHQRTFGTDVLRCPCGGRRTIRRLHSTRKQAEVRLTELRVCLPSRVLPPATAPPHKSAPLLTSSTRCPEVNFRSAGRHHPAFGVISS
jgi:hypothetical protein